jgi:TPP-dependent pyruvate/acetoin dehydrogenase alpha subunit
LPDLPHEALRFAGAHDLPIIFVCQSDPSAQNIRPHSQTDAKEIEVKGAPGFPGIPIIPVDGNDVVAVCRVAQEAIARARRGQGPTLIEAQICRWRSDSQQAVGKTDDPILNMEKYLAAKKLFTPEWKQEIVAAFNRELDAAIAVARKSPVAARKPPRTG